MNNSKRSYTKKLKSIVVTAMLLNNNFSAKFLVVFVRETLNVVCIISLFFFFFFFLYVFFFVFCFSLVRIIPIIVDNLNTHIYSLSFYFQSGHEPTTLILSESLLSLKVIS